MWPIFIVAGIFYGTIFSLLGVFFGIHSLGPMGISKFFNVQAFVSLTKILAASGALIGLISYHQQKIEEKQK